jgi:aconitase A
VVDAAEVGSCCDVRLDVVQVAADVVGQLAGADVVVDAATVTALHASSSSVVTG